MIKVSSTEFQQNVGRYQDAAQQAPVEITKNGRTHTVLMSASFFQMVMEGRIARRVEDLDEETIRAIANSRMSPEHAYLNRGLFADIENTHSHDFKNEKR